jgi:putative PIN family toxin of toxin-antitoxin system
MPTTITVDTNVWISTFLTPRGYSARLKNYWQANRFDVVISPQLLAEISEVLERPRIQAKYQYTSTEVKKYLQLIAELAETVQITASLKVCRDPDDDMLLETAVIGKATHLVSRDEDITRDTDVSQYLEKYGVKAITVQRFLETLMAP